MTIQKTYPYIMIASSLVGLLASFLLTIDTIKLIQDPKAELPCNINPFISCASIASSWQGAVFGFPNPLLGIASFSMFLVIGIMLAIGSSAAESSEVSNSLNRVFWLAINLGALVSMVFVVWFFYQSVYKIGSLCIYCMTVWTVTWPIFLYTTVWNIRKNNLPNNSFFRFISNNHFQILTAWYLALILLIIIRFKDFFLAPL